MLAVSSTFKSTLYVGVALAVALTVAGFASSTYRNERTDLAARHFQSGQWSLDHGDLAGAIDQLRKALLFSPDDEQYRLALADSLVQAKHLDEAETHLEQLAQEDPGNGRVNYLLAQIADKRGKTNQAIEFYQRAVYEYWPPDQIPERRRARWDLVNLLEKTGRTNEAIAELIQLNISANNPKERTEIAFALLKYGASSEAAQIFKQLLVSQPGDAAPRRGLGIVDFDNGDYVAARHQFQSALHLDAKDAESAQWLQLSNRIIDLDPLLPGITTAERLRRSQDLLTAVVTALTTCKPGIATNEEAASELTVANELLTSKQKIDGLADVMQQSAVQLWHDRNLFCNTPVADQNKAIETAIARVTGE